MKLPEFSNEDLLRISAASTVGYALNAFATNQQAEEARDLFWQLAARCERAEAEVRRLRGDDTVQCEPCRGMGKRSQWGEHQSWTCGNCDGTGRVPK